MLPSSLLIRSLLLCSLLLMYVCVCGQLVLGGSEVGKGREGGKGREVEGIEVDARIDDVDGDACDVTPPSPLLLPVPLGDE